MSYQCIGIIHGDIKPENVLIFKEDSQTVAKVADFGYATYFRDDSNWISMPKSEPWCAPEHKSQQFRPLEAKRMDVYLFAILCAWLLFGAGISMNLPLPPEMSQEIDQFVSFERSQSEMNLLQLLKSDKDNKLVEWIT